jgi:putative tricarboxylic transport membrane protein
METSAVTKRRWVHPVDLALSVAILSACAYVYYLTANFEEMSPLFVDNLPPQWFPRLLLWVIAFLALLMPFEHAVRVARGGSGMDGERKNTVKPIAYITVATMLVIVSVSQLLGTFLTLLAACLVLPPLWGERRWRLVAAFGIGFPIVVALLFSQVFKIYFQPGIFGLSFH